MIEGDNIIIGDYEYQLNDDLWKLLTLKDAGIFEDYTADVKHAYIDIMNKTKAYLNEKGKLHIAPPQATKILGTTLGQYEISLLVHCWDP